MFRNGYGASPNLRVQKKFVKFRKSTQNTWFRPVKFLGQFHSDPPFDFCRNLGDVLFCHPQIPRVNVFCDWPFLVFSCVSLETTAKFRSFLNVAIILRERKKSSNVVQTELGFSSTEELRVFNDKFTHFFNREIILESLTVKKWKSDKYYFNCTKVVIYISTITLSFLIFLLFSLRET